jgi:hypothetical protein
MVFEAFEYEKNYITTNEAYNRTATCWKKKIELTLNLRSIYKWIVFRIPTTTSFKPYLLHSCSLKMDINFTNICIESSNSDPSCRRISESRNSHNAAIQNVIMVISSLMVTSPWSKDGVAKASVNRLPRTRSWSWNTKHTLNKHDWGWCWAIGSKSKSCTTKREFSAYLMHSICSSLSAITPNNVDPYNDRTLQLFQFPRGAGL